MKILRLSRFGKITLSASLALIGLVSSVSAAGLEQTFEAGEDTSDWNSTWTGGSVTATFLDEALGGENAGSGSSTTQSFSRSFRNNLAGLDVSSPYAISMYVQLDEFDGPSGGQFEIIDGSFGDNNAANLRVTTTETPGIFKWQARDNNLGWLDLDIALSLGDPYHIAIAVDPDALTYSATVEHTDTSGSVIGSGSLFNLAINPNAITNGANGNLMFFIQASGGGTEAMVDNINIVPEPSVFALLAAGLLALVIFRRKQLTA